MKNPDIDLSGERSPRRIAALAGAVDAVLRPWHRAEVRGLHRVPEGAALYVSNHNGGLLMPEGLLLAAATYKAHGLGGVPYALAGDAVVRLPVLRQLTAPLGAVRATPENAQRLLARGAKVLVYPGADYDAMRPYRDRDKILFNGRRGYVRLALRRGAPLLPVVAAGAHAGLRILDDGRWLARLLGVDRRLRINVWPISLCLPWGLVIGPGLLYLPWPTRILMEVLEPIRFDRRGEEAAADDAYVRTCAAHVESTMQRALDRLSRERAAK